MYLRSRNTNQFGLGQTPNPDNMPTKPFTPPKDDIPTNPVVPQNWCPQLPKIQSSICFSYAPQEIAISKTEAGHLTPDVVLLPQGLVLPNPAMPNTVLSCQYLVIRDFGVDWRHLKLATKNEQLFKDSLTRFETDKSLTFRIVGYSDCVGVERNNFLLRRGRAQNVFQLFGSSARSRVLAVTVAPQGTYLTDNSTIAARASTRAVVVEIFINGLSVI